MTKQLQTMQLSCQKRSDPCLGQEWRCLSCSPELGSCIFLLRGTGIIIPKTQAKTGGKYSNFDSSVFKRGFFMDSPSTKQKLTSVLSKLLAISVHHRRISEMSLNWLDGHRIRIMSWSNTRTNSSNNQGGLLKGTKKPEVTRGRKSEKVWVGWYKWLRARLQEVPVVYVCMVACWVLPTF